MTNNFSLSNINNDNLNNILFNLKFNDFITMKYVCKKFENKIKKESQDLLRKYIFVNGYMLFQSHKIYRENTKFFSLLLENEIMLLIKFVFKYHYMMFIDDKKIVDFIGRNLNNIKSINMKFKLFDNYFLKKYYNVLLNDFSYYQQDTILREIKKYDLPRYFTNLFYDIFNIKIINMNYVDIHKYCYDAINFNNT